MNRLGPFYLGIILCCLIVTLFFSSVLFNLAKPLDLNHWDAFVPIFILKHYMHVASSGNWNEFQTSDMFYGFKNSQFYSDSFITQAFFTAPLYWLTKNILITFNLVSFLTILFSFVAMYIFVWFLTRKVLVGILAAVIFTLNPFAMSHFPDRPQLYSLEWIPLIFLFFERSLKNPTNKNTLFLFCFLSAQLLSSFYYSAFLTVIFPVYALVRVRQTETHLPKFVNLGTVLGLMIFGAIGWGLFSTYGQIFDKVPDVFQYAASGAAAPLDFFLTTSNNFLYGGLREKIMSFGFEWEHSLFLGIVPSVLLFFSFKILRSSPKRKLWQLYLILLLVSFLIALGPKVGGLYSLIYHINPLFHNIRLPSRMGVFIFFFLSLILALTMEKRRNLTILLITLLILLEYLIKPVQFMDIRPQIREAYSFLNSQNQIKVILEYPISNTLPENHPDARLIALDTHYLLYGAILHQKKLLNGFGSYFPLEYLKRAKMLSINFPNPLALKDLKSWGVDGIILHKEEFPNPERFNNVKKGLTALKVPLIYSSDDIAIFDLTSKAP